MKKIFFALCIIALCGALCLPMLAFGGYGADTYEDGMLVFSKYTSGADAAFDGKKSTAYAGSVTGKFAKKSVITGLTVEVLDEVINLKIYGSENGDEWIELYSAPKIRSISVFGSDGSGEYTDDMLNTMYTYAFTYLRIEIEYGSLAEINMRGYETATRGSISELDTDYALGGFNCSNIYSADDVPDKIEFTKERGAHITEHIIGSKEHGGAVLKDDSAPCAHFTIKLKTPSVLTEIAFIHLSNDKNVTRWNNTLFEASTDGESWDTVGILPPDFSYMNDLRGNRTMIFLPVLSDVEYSYVRLSVPKGGMSIGAIDIYSEYSAPAIEVPSILNEWETDPYTALKKDKQTEAQKEQTSEAETADLQPDGGCGSSVAVYASSTLLCAALCTLIARKRKR